MKILKEFNQKFRILNRLKWLFEFKSTSAFVLPNWVQAVDARSGKRLPGFFIFRLFWLSNYASPRRLWKMWQAHNSLQLPRIQKSEEFKDSIWGIGIVRDEEDVIEIAIRNLFNQGCDAIIVIDHGSSDSTFEIIKQLKMEYPNLYFGSCSTPAFFQSFILTKLAAYARRAGALWVIPFDADEIWVSAEISVAKKLATCDVGVAIADIYNCYPIGEVESFEEFLVDSKPLSTKRALRVHKGMLIPYGNHEDISKWRKKQHLLAVMHFPWRSKSQLMRKVNQGAQAEKDAKLSGWHWQWAAKQSNAKVEEIWNLITNGYPVPELQWSRIDESSQLSNFDWHELLGPRPPV